MGDSYWMSTSRSVLNLPACQAQSFEGNQHRKRPALMSKHLQLRKLNFYPLWFRLMYYFDVFVSFATLLGPAWPLDLLA